MKGRKGGDCFRRSRYIMCIRKKKRVTPDLPKMPRMLKHVFPPSPRSSGGRRVALYIIATSDGVRGGKGEGACGCGSAYARDLLLALGRRAKKKKKKKSTPCWTRCCVWCNINNNNIMLLRLRALLLVPVSGTRFSIFYPGSAPCLPGRLHVLGSKISTVRCRRPKGQRSYRTLILTRFFLNSVQSEPMILTVWTTFSNTFFHGSIYIFIAKSQTYFMYHNNLFL